MSISLSKKDIYWSYLAQFFSLASGIIILPMVLRMLSTEEIAMNYLMLTIGSLVALFDFGFAPQFGRNITYIFSGVQELKKENISIVEKHTGINYRLLATMISTAQFVYRRLALLVLSIMLTLGTLYIYHITHGFTTVKNSLLIWCIYSLSTFFNIYYSYFNSLLTGRGLIMESKKAMVFSRIAYLILSFGLLYLGMGLVGLSLANLITPFVNRYISYYYFFTKDIKENINTIFITRKEKYDLFKKIWYNSKKLGLVFIGSYAISKLSMFLAGLFLSLDEVASYGLMIQLVGLIMTVSTTLFYAYNPIFSALRVEHNNDKLIRTFAFTMNIYYLLFIIGSLFLIFIIPWLLQLVGSNAVLPNNNIVILFCFIMFLEGNHSCFSTMIVTKNKIPFVESSLIAGAVIAIGDYLSLAFTSLGIWGLVLVQGITQIVYANWKWPFEICKEFGITPINFLKLGFKSSLEKFAKYRYVYK
ncbi:MAG: polysaccharide biosynthesis protein [Prevotella sp.]|nr:polysaccharide biosynthesis protein [Prevotella sp.]